MALLTVSGVAKERNGRRVVSDVSFSQHFHEKLAIAGETGSGKTSLLRMIGGLLQPDAGEIFFNGEKVMGPDYQLIPGQKGMGYLSQHFELLNNYRVHEILEMNNLLSDDDAAQIYEICQISHLLQRRTDALSGGEKQRIALAKILIKSPQLILLDEPFSNLDLPHKQTIKQVLHDLGDTLRISFVLVSHDASDVLPWADRILLMRDGRVIQEGSPRELYHRPMNTYCAGLLGDFNLLQRADGSQWMIRPEHVLLTTERDGLLSGHVHRVEFCGHHDRIIVNASGVWIHIAMINPGVTPGDIVHLSWRPEDAHLLQ